MKKLISTVLFLSVISMLFVKAELTKTSFTIDDRQTWIESLLNEHDKSLNCNDYIFYCTGHHGIIWSVIVMYSLGISVYNGTTRKHIDYANQNIPDTLSFIKNNIKTIRWGIDSSENRGTVSVVVIIGTVVRHIEKLVVVPDDLLLCRIPE